MHLTNYFLCNSLAQAGDWGISTTCSGDRSSEYSSRSADFFHELSACLRLAVEIILSLEQVTKNKFGFLLCPQIFSQRIVTFYKLFGLEFAYNRTYCSNYFLQLFIYNMNQCFFDLTEAMARRFFSRVTFSVSQCERGVPCFL